MKAIQFTDRVGNKRTFNAETYTVFKNNILILQDGSIYNYSDITNLKIIDIIDDETLNVSFTRSEIETIINILKKAL